MEEEAAAKLVGIEDRPPTTRDWSEFVLSGKGKLDGRSTVALGDSVVHVCGDAQARDLAEVVLPEGQVRLRDVV